MKMVFQQSGRLVLQKAARCLVLKVFRYFKWEADSGVPVRDVAKFRQHTADTYGEGLVDSKPQHSTSVSLRVATCLLM